MRLYRKGTQFPFHEIKLDTVVVNDSEVEKYRADGWSDARTILDRHRGVEAFDEADANNTGKLSADEVRQYAKEQEIEGWDTKRIKTLKKELGIQDGDK